MSSDSPPSDIPSTPTSAPTSVTPTVAPPSTTRRSARVHKRDPIVAPGFGTQQDLITLAKDLGQPVEVVHAIMASQGRGTRRRVATTSNTAAAAAAATSTTTKPAVVVNAAWANFLSEEHPTAGTTTTAEPHSDVTSTNPQTDATFNNNNNNNTITDTRKTYQLPMVPAWAKTPQKPKSKKAKTTKSAAAAAAATVVSGIGNGGILVQTGTLDASAVGRTKLALDRSFDLKVPSILLPRLKVSKVIASCNAAHALAIDTTGRLYGWGRNESSQLGAALGSSYIGRPFVLEGFGLDNNTTSSCVVVVDAAIGKSHSIVLTQNQELWAVGSNKAGQCGIKSSIDVVPNFRKCNLDVSVIQVCLRETLLHGLLYICCGILLVACSFLCFVLLLCVSCCYFVVVWFSCMVLQNMVLWTLEYCS